MKIKIGNIVLTICIIVNIILLGYGVTYWVKSGPETYCGVVKHKITTTYFGKYRIHESPNLIISFDNGKLCAIKVDIVTYMDHNEGDRICFELGAGYFEDTSWRRDNYEDKAKKYTFLFIATTLLTLCVWGVITD